MASKTTAPQARSAPAGALKAGYRILLDAPADRPALGYPEIARALADIVMESAPRFAIGIFGGWGSGKTTLMQAIEERLDRAPCVPVRFSAWRYEKEEHLILPLLDTDPRCAARMGRDRPGHVQASRETARTIGRVMRAIVAGMSMKIGVPGAINVSFEANKALEGGPRKSERDDARVPRLVLPRELPGAAATHSRLRREHAEDRRRIVVFIDDLDRCLPESALQVLESMKLFFDLPGFVFVVGLDQDVVEHVVDSKYHREQNGDGDDAGESRVLARTTSRKSSKCRTRSRRSWAVLGQLQGFLTAIYDEADLPDAQRDEFRRVVDAAVADEELEMRLDHTTKVFTAVPGTTAEQWVKERGEELQVEFALTPASSYEAGHPGRPGPEGERLLRRAGDSPGRGQEPQRRATT